MIERINESISRKNQQNQMVKFQIQKFMSKATGLSRFSRRVDKQAESSGRVRILFRIIKTLFTDTRVYRKTIQEIVI